MSERDRERDRQTETRQRETQRHSPGDRTGSARCAAPSVPDVAIVRVGGAVHQVERDTGPAPADTHTHIVTLQVSPVMPQHTSVSFVTHTLQYHCHTHASVSFVTHTLQYHLSQHTHFSIIC